MRWVIILALWFPGCLAPTAALAVEPIGVRPLQRGLDAALSTLPAGSHILLDQPAIERFLRELDSAPPDWTSIYGKGHHDPDHDERLFALNRERDARREGRAALQWRIAFLWIGELSRFDDQSGGFRVALGPKFNRTDWGEVRFKPEDLPATLVALAGHDTARLNERLRSGEPVAIDVLMFGRLIPEESLLYDFSHEKEGQGLIMPVVQVEAVEFILKGGR
ncbi:MAG: exported protein of unknown function [Nitrospira sp.]|nr:exported protein of unknown function [Nitrospira sp.]